MVNPNAIACGGSGGSALLLIALLSLVGITLPPLAAGAIVVGCSTAFVWLGRKGLYRLVGEKGIKGLISKIWRGGPAA